MAKNRRNWLVGGAIALVLALAFALVLPWKGSSSQSTAVEDVTSLRESVETRVTSGSSQSTAAEDVTSLKDSVETRLTSGSSQSTAVADLTSLKESVETRVTSGANQPPPGGATDQGRVKESVEYIIRDASGKIKGQKSFGGP